MPKADMCEYLLGRYECPRLFVYLCPGAKFSVLGPNLPDMSSLSPFTPPISPLSVFGSDLQ